MRQGRIRSYAVMIGVPNVVDLFMRVFAHPSNGPETGAVASALSVAVAGWQESESGSAEQQAAVIGGALEHALRSPSGEPLVPYLDTEARGAVADELEGHAWHVQRRGLSGKAALAKVLAAVLRAEIADLALGRADPTAVRLLATDTKTGRRVPAEDINRLLEIEGLVERQLLQVLRSAKVVDRVARDGLFRFSIHPGEEALDDIVVDYRLAGATAAS